MNVTVTPTSLLTESFLTREELAEHLRCSVDAVDSTGILRRLALFGTNRSTVKAWRICAICTPTSSCSAHAGNRSYYFASLKGSPLLWWTVATARTCWRGTRNWPRPRSLFVLSL